jgi:adenylate cyclase
MMKTGTQEIEVLTGAVAFTDICGFTEFTAVRGDRDALGMLAAQERVVRDLLPAGARLVKELGDGLLLWFPDALTALTTTMDLQDGFQAEAVASEFPLWVRIGTHWGSQTRRGADLIGHDVNVAARVVDVAGPGEVVLTEALLSNVPQERRGTIAVDELGPVLMKGLAQPVRLFRATRC